jgi:hypothetical protein
MTGNEYRAAIRRLGLSQAGAARLLGVNETTSRRWIKDKHPIPISADLLLRVMVAHRITPENVMLLSTKKLK